MLNTMFCARLVAGWFGAVGVAFACRIVIAAPMSIGAEAPWLSACLVIPAVTLLMQRGGFAVPVAESVCLTNDPAEAC